MLGNWSIKASAPGDNLYVAISVQHPKLGDYFSATLKLKRVSPSLGSDHSSFFYLMPHKVAIWIYWHVSGIFVSFDLAISCLQQFSVYPEPVDQMHHSAFIFNKKSPYNCTRKS